MADCLGRYIGNLVSQGEIKGLQPSSHPLVCFHGKFVDDTIFMGKAKVREARNLKKALSLYSYASGQLLNWSKSLLFFVNTIVSRQSKIDQILGCSIGSFPCIYLGLPLGPNALESFGMNLLRSLIRN